jgi:hypothetical protein
MAVIAYEQSSDLLSHIPFTSFSWYF